MKITCTTENVIEKKESCRKTYCCNRLKIAMNRYKNGKGDYNYINSHFTIGEKKVILETHSSYHEESHYMNVDFCPFCGKALVIEHKKIDKTGLPPQRPPMPKPKPELKQVLTAASPKKKTLVERILFPFNWRKV